MEKKRSKLYYTMKAKDISVAELAEYVGTTKASIYLYWSGHEMSLPVRKLISQYLNVSESELG